MSHSDHMESCAKDADRRVLYWRDLGENEYADDAARHAAWCRERAASWRKTTRFTMCLVASAYVALFVFALLSGCSTPNGSVYEKADARLVDMKAFRAESAETHKLMRELSVKMDQNTKLLCLALERAGEKK